jgi:tetratricopeptide (TPR) repeat protein
MTLLENGDKAAAARVLAEPLPVPPRVPNWLVTVGILQEQAGDHAGAVATYRTVLSVQPANFVALNNAAFALAVHMGQPEEALPLAKRAASLAPRVGTVIDTYAWIEHLLGHDDVAARLIAEAIRLEPKQPEIRLHAASMYVALKQLDRAQAELKEALRLDPALGTREDVRQLRERITTPH